MRSGLDRVSPLAHGARRMATLTFAQALSKYRIAITPVLRRRGNPTWLAGQRMLNGDGITNIIDPTRKVEGRESPEDALRVLLQLIGPEDVLVGDDELPDPHAGEEPEAKSERKTSTIPTDKSLIIEEKGKFVLRLPDGREFRAARRRDLVRKARLVGVAA